MMFLIDETLATIENLAASKYMNGNFTEAVELLRKALRIREETSAFEIEKDEKRLRNMTNLAASLGHLKKFEEAKKIFKTVLEIREKQFGSDDLEVLTTTNYMGVIMKQNKQLFEAEVLLRKALDGLDRYYDNYTNTKCLENTNVNEDNKSINLNINKADINVNSVNGERYTSIYAETCYNYAVLCVQLGIRKRAGKYFGKAHKGLIISVGKENPHTLDALHWEIKCTCDTQVKGSPILTMPVADNTLLSLPITSDALSLAGDKIPDEIMTELSAPKEQHVMILEDHPSRTDTNEAEELEYGNDENNQGERKDSDKDISDSIDLDESAVKDEDRDDEFHVSKDTW
eukprot:CAMPEP_0119033510 /NCGR_PEP_ID=MMETSP1177-20130426/553_1 /TAXON_ID=2985 /ORGANISM="Ochromonas sp, Strain CCMP1899" /LENGTH=344 /DNA_ID=CAMNT_0006990299 /DNA_START=50 /DNA_END=1081 /DNA_ORIENTATION=-